MWVMGSGFWVLGGKRLKSGCLWMALAAGAVLIEWLAGWLAGFVFRRRFIVKLGQASDQSDWTVARRVNTEGHTDNARMGIWYVLAYIDTLVKYATEGIHATSSRVLCIHYASFVVSR